MRALARIVLRHKCRITSCQDIDLEVINEAGFQQKDYPYVSGIVSIDDWTLALDVCV